MQLARALYELNAKLTACGITRRATDACINYLFRSGQLPKPRWESGRFDYSEKDVEAIFRILKERWTK